MKLSTQLQRLSQDIDWCWLALITAIIVGALFFFGWQIRLAMLLAAPLYLLLRSRVSVSTLHAVVLAILVVYPVFIACIQVAYYLNADQGVDFGIFSQIIFQVATHGALNSSLIGIGWHNFLTHHLSPYLFVLGWIARIGIDPGYLLITAHVISVSALVLGLYKVFQAQAEDRQRAALMTCIVLFLPALRRGLCWETHDEVLALPFIVWSLYLHLIGKDRAKLFMLMPTLLFKETLGLNIFGVALYYAFSRERHRLYAIALAIIGLTTFVLYTRVLPHWLWTPTFDLSTRVGTFEQLTSWETLSAKSVWLLKVFAPIAPFLLIHSRSSISYSIPLVLCVASNLAAIAITNVPAMYEPYNYYAITPATLVSVAFLLPIARSRYLFHCSCFALIIASFVGTRIDSKALISEVVRSGSAQAEIRGVVARDKVVIADDYTTSILAPQREVIRVFHANGGSPRFDYIVMQKERPEKLSRYLRSWSTQCAETPRFVVRCAYPSARPM